jgi:adenylate cyclase, class 2
MKEIEVKILEIDPEKIVAKLKELGAKKIEQGLAKIKAYDFHDRKLRDADTFIRVREIAGRTEVVYKGPVTDSKIKTREEIEFHTDNFENACKIFERLDMKQFADCEKYRATYKLGDVKIEMDKYPKVPWFFEIEATTEELVIETLHKLGFSMDDENVINRGFHARYGYGAENEKFDTPPDYDKLFE